MFLILCIKPKSYANAHVSGHFSKRKLAKRLKGTTALFWKKNLKTNIKCMYPISSMHHISYIYNLIYKRWTQKKYSMHMQVYKYLILLFIMQINRNIKIKKIVYFTKIIKRFFKILFNPFCIWKKSSLVKRDKKSLIIFNIKKEGRKSTKVFFYSQCATETNFSKL